MDVVYLGVVLVFFALTWGILKICEILQQDKSGGNS